MADSNSIPILNRKKDFGFDETSFDSKFLASLKEVYKEDKRNVLAEKISSGLSNIYKFLEENINQSGILKSFLGPLRLVTDPLENQFGIFKKLENSLNSFFSGKFNKNTIKVNRDSFLIGKDLGYKENNLKKLGVFGSGFLYLGNFFKSLLKEQNKGFSGLFNVLGKSSSLGQRINQVKSPDVLKKGKFDSSIIVKSLSSSFGGFLAGLIPSLGVIIKEGIPKFLSNLNLAGLSKIFMKAIPFVSIGIFITDGIFDAISNVFSTGSLKISDFLSSFLAGNGASGLKNAFANAGKYALLGAGIGVSFGIVGVIAGGIIGGAIGGIIGFFGKEKLSNFFQGVSNIFGSIIEKSSFLDALLNPFTQIFNFIKERFKSFILILISPDSLSKKLGRLVGEIGRTMIDFLFLPIRTFVSQIKKNFKFFIDFLKSFKNFVFNSISFLRNNIEKFKVFLFTVFFTAVQKIIDLVKSISLEKVVNSIKDFIVSLPSNLNFFLTSLAENFKNLFKNLKTKAEEFFEKNPILKFIGEFFSGLFESIFNPLKDTLEYLKGAKNPVDVLSKLVDITSGDSKFKDFISQQQDKRELEKFNLLYNKQFSSLEEAIQYDTLIKEAEKQKKLEAQRQELIQKKEEKQKEIDIKKQQAESNKTLEVLNKIADNTAATAKTLAENFKEKLSSIGGDINDFLKTFSFTVEEVD